jgi:O-succinylbenzoic acid--CoA ligase
MANINMNIQWETNFSDILINPCYPEHEQHHFRKILDFASTLPGHLWLATSGSTVTKWVGLSKQAILASAQSVNRHLESNAKDKWMQTLPDFHVGGLGIWARSYLNGALVVNFREKYQGKYQGKWNAQAFYQFAIDTQGTLTSLVPAQLHDLVQLGFQAPPTLRAVIIGGGFLVPKLYHQAIQLGWKILPSYGLTECASQVATAQLGSWEEIGVYPSLQVLSHLQVKKEENGCLAFKSASLLSAYALNKEQKFYLYDPRIEGWLLSEDRGEINEGMIKILGRTDQMIKIGGESVDLARLESLLQEIILTLKLPLEMALVSIPDARLGSVIHLAAAEKMVEAAHHVLTLFNQSVLPFERIRNIHLFSHIPKSGLSKVIKSELIKSILLPVESRELSS